MLTYPEIRGVLAEMEQEFMDAGKQTPAQQSFSNKARYVLAMVDRRLANKIKRKHEQASKNKFFF